MKTLLRILVILVAAGLIAGLAVAIVNVSGAQAAQPIDGAQFHSGQFVPRNGQGDFHGGRGGELNGSFALAETLKNLIVVAVIVAAVAVLERTFKLIRRKRPAEAPVQSDRPDPRP
jgi:hypothetical protein